MLGAYLSYFQARYGRDVEFIVVINGSTDRTEDVVKAHTEQYKGLLRYIVEPACVGKGGALIRGFAEARGDLVGFSDADGSTPPEAFQDLVDKIGDGGAIIASRWLEGSVVEPRQPLKRRIASRIFNLLVDVLFNLGISDTQCGAKLMKAEAIRAVLPRLGTTRWAFDVDLLFQLRRAGYRIRECATVWRDTEASHLKVARASIEMFLAICRLRLLYSPFRWIVKGYKYTLGPFIDLDK